MKNLSKGLLLLSAVAMGFSSCSDDAPWGGSDNEGGINLKFASDARVMRQSRADDGMSPVVPDASRFGVNLVKSDDSYSKEWSSIDGFNKEKTFPIGDYTLTASFGDVEQEGFENPCFKGSAQVHVSPGAVTNVDVVATLANAMVSVRYTDEFVSNFPGYSAAVQTAGHDWVVFAQEEDRPAYVSPSEEVKLKLTLTNESDQRVDIQPASFRAVARHHYVVTIGVKEGQASGGLALDVVFDDDVVAETVNVSLGDELFTAPAPTLTAKGFDPSVAIDAFEYAEQPAQTEFHVFAFGGLKSANLTVISDGYTPTFGRSVELVGADDLTQKQLSAAGVECSGFFRNPDKMGVVNVTKFIENLPAGNYTVALTAVDAMTRTSEPVELKAAIKPVELEVSSVGNVGFMANEMKVQVSTNCPDIKNNVKFQVPNSLNQMVDAVVKSVEEVSAPGNARTRADLSYHFNYTLALEPQIRDLIDVTAKVGRKSASIKVPMAAPEYTITPDAFARKVVLKIETDDSAVAKALADQLTFANAGSAIASSNISHDADGNIVIIGLTPGVEYVSLNAKIGAFEKTVPAFTTETEAQIPNSNFANLKNPVEFSNVQAGGKYRTSAAGIYTNKTTVSYQEPVGWATLNELTCWPNSSPMNTWFIVPSTIASNGSVLIRSVGYHHAGTEPERSGNLMNTTYYCTNAPSELLKAAGEMFLGSYSCDASGAGKRVEGMDFSTRPSSLSFNYNYESVNGRETGEVSIKVIGEGGKILSAKVENIRQGNGLYTVSLPSYPFNEKAASICVGFKSTAGSDVDLNIPTGGALNDHVSNRGGTVPANQSNAVAVGSKLTVSNVKLGYEASSIATPNAAKRRSNRK